ncbi:MAG TPA: response regulator [Desulfomicrobiaceae bacterium]|nr:response regulator [Desulfomicrobiaceae bacterium]
MPTQPSSDPILVIEDDPLFGSFLQEWLEAGNRPVLRSSTGTGGLELFRDHRPAIILLDLGIPGLDGFELLNTFMREDPEAAVIIITGRMDIDAVIRAFKSGARDYVTKPIQNLDLLEKTITNCLEHKHLRDRIREADNQYFNLIQNLPVVLFVINRNLKVTFINRTCRTMLGYTPQEVVQAPTGFVRKIHPQDRDVFLQRLTDFFTSPSYPFSIEFRMKHAKGYLLTLQAQVIAPADKALDAESEKVEGIILDVTKRNFLDKILMQREKMNTLGAMSAELAHEIRNPLVSLGGFARRMYSRYPELTEAKVILDETVRLENLFNRIHDYLEPVPVVCEQCQLNSLLSFCVDLMDSGLQRRFVHSNFIPNPANPSVNSDPELLTQVFMNIMNFGAEIVLRSGILEITSREARGHVEVVFTVSPVEYRIPNPESLFLPFEKESRNYNLALSYRHMRTLGGHLAFQQHNGRAEFTVSLPHPL